MLGQYPSVHTHYEQDWGTNYIVTMMLSIIEAQFYELVVEQLQTSFAYL